MYCRKLNFFSPDSNTEISTTKKDNNYNSRIYVITGPSGVGKSTIIEALLIDIPKLEKIIPYTTRPMRPGEVEGKSYFYIDKSEFKTKKHHHDFLTYLKFSGNRYGFGLTNEMHTKMKTGTDLILDVHYTQIQAIKQSVDNSFVICIMPPSLESLQKRLIQRGDDREDIKRRMSCAQDMMDHEELYDKSICNEDGQVAKTINEIKEIILEHRINCSYNVLKLS